MEEEFERIKNQVSELYDDAKFNFLSSRKIIFSGITLVVFFTLVLLKPRFIRKEDNSISPLRLLVICSALSVSLCILYEVLGIKKYYLKT